MLPDLSPYKDVRREFFKQWFDRGLGFQEYLKTGDTNQQQRWGAGAELLELTPEQSELLSSFKRKMNVLVLSGIWCGDCARQGGMWNLIASTIPDCELRFVDNKSNPEFQDELRLNGAEKVPVVVVLSEDFFEVARFGDAHLSVYRRKAVQQLGAACDTGLIGPDPDEMNAELAEWIAFFERCQLMLRLAPMLRRRHND